MKTKKAQRGVPLDPRIRVKLAAAVLKRSERVVAKKAFVSRQSLARALAGLPVYRGTIALIENFLDEVAAPVIGGRQSTGGNTDGGEHDR